MYKKYFDQYKKLKYEYLNLKKSNNNLSGGFTFLQNNDAYEIIQLFDLKYIIDNMGGENLYDNDKFKSILYNITGMKQNLAKSRFDNLISNKKKELNEIYTKNKDLFDYIADDEVNQYKNTYITVLKMLEPIFKDKLWTLVFEKKKHNVNNKIITEDSVIEKNVKRSIFNYYNDTDFSEQDNVIVVRKQDNVIVFSNGNRDTAKCYIFDISSFQLNLVNDEITINKIRNMREIEPSFGSFSEIQVDKFILSINQIKNILSILYSKLCVVSNDEIKTYGIKNNELNKELASYISKLININSNEFTKLNHLIYAHVFTNKLHFLFMRAMPSSDKYNIGHNVFYNSKENEKDGEIYTSPEVIYAYNYFKRIDFQDKLMKDNIKFSPKEIADEFKKELVDFYKGQDELTQILYNYKYSQPYGEKYYINWPNIILCAYILHIIINTTNIHINKFSVYNQLISVAGSVSMDVDENLTEKIKTLLLNKTLPKDLNKIKFSPLNYMKTYVESPENYKHTFSSCGETATMNLMNYILIRENGMFYIPDNASSIIVEFYKKFPSIDNIILNQSESTMFWAKLIANQRDVMYAKGDDSFKCEIRSLPKNIATLLDILIPNTLSKENKDIIYSNNDLSWDKYYEAIAQFISSISPTTNSNIINENSSYRLIIDDNYTIEFSGTHSVFVPTILKLNDSFSYVDLFHDIDRTHENNDIVLKLISSYNNFTIFNYNESLNKLVTDKYEEIIKKIFHLYYIEPMKNIGLDNFQLIGKAFNRIYLTLNNIYFSKNISNKIKIYIATYYYIKCNEILFSISHEKTRRFDNIPTLEYVMPNSNSFGIFVHDIIIKEYGIQQYHQFLSNPKQFIETIFN
jgi:hypothetical protein